MQITEKAIEKIADNTSICVSKRLSGNWGSGQWFHPSETNVENAEIISRGQSPSITC